MELKKFQERKQIYLDALNCRKPLRIPTLSNAWAWKILDCDSKPSFLEATSNWDVMEKVVREHMERYGFDSFTDVGFRFNSSYKPILGEKIRHNSDDEHSVQALDTTAMKEDEYDLLIKQGPAMFEWTTLYPRLFGELTFGDLNRLIGCYGAFGAFVGKMFAAQVGEYSCPILSVDAVQTPTEELFNQYRGIKGLSNDMRRQPEKILEYIEAAKGETLAKTHKMIDTTQDSMICSFTIPFLAPTVLNPKQFEKFYFPLFKEICTIAEENGKGIYLFVEGETKRFVEYFKEFTKGTFVLHVETDNIFEIKKLLPNTCIAGGMPVDLLGANNKNRCIDFTKKLCEELGGSGYVFSTNKMMTYAYDGTRENMLAVQNFVLDYKL